MLIPVDTQSGQVSTADSMGPATSLVMNWIADVAGVNRIRPALVTYTTTGLNADPLIGLYRWKTYMFAVDSARKLWAMADGAPTVWVALTDTTTAATTTATSLDGALRPVFAEDASDLFIVGGGDIQKWTGAGFTARLGAGPQASFIANIGQRLIANDLTNPTRYYYSDAGDGSDGTWQALSFITAEARPDPIKAIYENTAELGLFGSTTLEIHGISADPLIPFQRINTLNIGISAPYSVIKYDNQYVWLDDRRRFVLSDGRGYEVISEAIQKDLRRLATVEDCIGYREDTDTYNCLVFVFPASRRTFAYEYGSKKWGERALYDGVSANTAWPVAAHAYWDVYNLNVLGATTAGLFQLDTTVRQDIGGTILAERITGWNDYGSPGRKRSGGIKITMRRGTTPLAATSGELEVAVEDDGKGWSPFKTVTLGQPSDFETNQDFYFGGIFYRRRIWVRYSGSDDMSLVSIAEDVMPLEMKAAA